MSSFVSFDYAKNLIREHQVKYWKLKDSDGRSILGEQKDGEITVEESLSMLERAVSDIEGNYVLLELRGRSTRDKSAGGDVKSGNFDLRIKLNGNGMQGIGSTAGGFGHPFYQTLNDRINQLELQNLKIQHEYEKKNLQRQIDEYKEGNPMADAVIAALGNLFMPGGGVAQQAAPVAAQPVRALAGTEEKKPGRIQEALKRLAAVDKNLIENLETLASFAEKNPTGYFMAVEQLKNM